VIDEENKKENTNAEGGAMVLECVSTSNSTYQGENSIDSAPQLGSINHSHQILVDKNNKMEEEPSNQAVSDPSNQVVSEPSNQPFTETDNQSVPKPGQVLYV